MPVQRRYRQSREQPIASFEFTDITQGTGGINFYAGNTSGAFLLTPKTFFSSLLGVSGTTTSGNYVQIKDIDFDADINNTFTIKGQGIIQIPIRLGQAAGASCDGYSEAIVYKVVGGVETNLGQASGAVHQVTAGTTTEFIDAVNIDLPNTIFKRNDKLRLNVRTYARTNGGGTATIELGNDPQNRVTAGGSSDWTDGNTNLIFQVPFKLNL